MQNHCNAEVNACVNRMWQLGLKTDLKQEVCDIQNLVLLLFSFVGDIDGNFRNLDVDEEFVLLRTYFHLLHVVLVERRFDVEIGGSGSGRSFLVLVATLLLLVFRGRQLL